MGQDTDIQWCDSTVNPTSGCDGCELKIPGKAGSCYAVPIHVNRLAKSFPANYSADFHEVRTIAGRMAKAGRMSDLRGKARPNKPWLNGMPRMIFVGDLGDLFSKAVPFGFIESEVVGTAISDLGSRHIYMLLTKQPSRAAEFGEWLDSPWPDNVWAGVSVTSEKTERRSRVGCLIPAKFKYLSVEPMFGPIRFEPSVLAQYSLVICGGESGPNARAFNLAWARDLRDQCRKAGVAFFMKQCGAKPFDSFYVEDQAIQINDSHGGDWDEWPEDLRVREFPHLVAIA